MNSVCKFISKKGADGELYTHRFVYEADSARIEKESFAVTYIFNVVMSGIGVLEIEGERYEIERGSAFFVFPGQEYGLRESKELTFTYISFTGERAANMLADVGVTPKSAPARGLFELCDFMDKAVRRVNDKNGKYLAEAALLYAVAEISDSLSHKSPVSKNENLFGSVIDYIERHYTDRDLSLKKLGEIYSYTDKYISALIRANLGVGFSDYVTKKRMENAKKLMSEGKRSVSDVAFFCGYSDPLYFSKVFKQTFGMSPSEYIGKAQTESANELSAQLLKKYLD